MDGLTQMVIEARLKAALPLVIHCVGGQCNDWAFKSPSAKFRRRLITIHYWHLEVHQKDIIVFLPGLFDCLFTIFCSPNFGSCDRQVAPNSAQ